MKKKKNATNYVTYFVGFYLFANKSIRKINIIEVIIFSII